MEPLGDDDIRKLRSSTQSQDQQASTMSQSTTAAGASVRTRSLTGNADQLDPATSFPPQFQKANQSKSEDEQEEYQLRLMLSLQS